MTIQNTPTYAFPYPQGSDLADGPTQIAALATRMEAVLASLTARGLRSARPTSGLAGARFFATDQVADWFDTGAGWVRAGLAAGATACILTSTIPAGWVVADGSAVPNTGATVDLFAAIGAALPDLRGRVPVGVDGAAGRLAANDTLSAVGGEESHTLASTEAAVASHGHGLNDPGHAHIAGSIGNSWAIIANAGGGSRAMAPLRFDVGTYQFQDASGLLGGATGAASTGQTVQNHNGAAAAAAHNTMQPFQVLNWIVKL